ncbi:uncharacterized protein LOC128767082 [Synchiropus splendidus]|uniref:uncharacterized protein LOC128767082 n=1 Tax=Synchiropus splendidus TaxID=270530 RepID=UPI00237EB823|nr:uncharacterized protein LOC128767082 [Synchiropus splendidus]
MTCAVNMKPVSYQKILPSMEGGHQAMALNRVLNASRMMHCDKCGFSTADSALFRRHLNEHNGTMFHCFYCARVLFSEAELNSHLQEHTKYQYKCPHCGQGYMRRLCLLKHIDRLHSKNVHNGPSKPAVVKPLLTPVCSVSTSTPQPPQMVISHVQRKVILPKIAPAVCVNGRRETQRTLEINLQKAKMITEACTSSLNVNTHNNMALTVALPEEVTIPAGCKVELVEVKTVNGSKELKLRLVSKQEHNSVVNDVRTSAAASAAVEKATHSNEPINLSAVNRRLIGKPMNSEYPAVVKVNIPDILTNQAGGVKVARKRKRQECMNLKWHHYTPKTSKLTINSVGELNVARAVTQVQRSDDSTKASPAVDCSQLLGLLNSENHRTSQKTGTDRGYIDLVGSSSDKPGTGTNPSAVKVEPVQGAKKDDSGLTKREAAPSESVRPSSSNASLPIRPAAVSRHLETVSRPPPCIPQQTGRTQPSILKKPPVSTHGQRQDSSQEPKGFPVISSVFSLSQQPQGDQGPIQPLMMALRGIIMDKTPVSNGVKKVDSEAKSQHCTQVPSGSKPVVEKATNDHVKMEIHEENIQHVSQASVQVKQEKVATADKSSGSHDLKPPKEEPPSSECSPVKNVARSDAPKTNPCLSRYLTVSLTRIDDAARDHALKVPKLKVVTHKTRTQNLGDCTVLYTMPLKGDQLVKRPGPNQPVVVLNHPKPRAPIQVQAAPLLDTEEQIPRCQILKMKLSKVMGQKYEVMGCTVRVCP